MIYHGFVGACLLLILTLFFLYSIISGIAELRRNRKQSKTLESEIQVGDIYRYISPKPNPFEEDYIVDIEIMEIIEGWVKAKQTISNKIIIRTRYQIIEGGYRKVKVEEKL